MSIVKDFISLIYPHCCASCGKALYKSEKCICTYCQYHLPKTNFHLVKDNFVCRKFWGKVNINAATSYYYFNKGSSVQRLIHQLKYKGNKEIGVTIGNIMGNELKIIPLFNTIDYIIPVPLHFKKERKRGYNQSDFFAKGLSLAMGKKYYTNILYRIAASESQTKKGHYERWENVENIFKVKNVQQISGSHILLVDDVVTTGSTLEACANALLSIPDTKVSIATIACT